MPKGPGDAVFVIVTSAVEGVPTTDVAEAVLLAGVGSVVVEVTVAVFVMLVPIGLAGLIITMIVKFATPAAGSDAIEHVTVPVAPPAGVVHKKVGPAVWDSETKVVFAGMTSVSVTAAASDGPLFVTAIA